MSETRRVLVFGLGYSAGRFARRAVAAGMRVTGTTRDAAKAASLRSAGIEVMAFDERAVAEALASATHVIVSAAPDEAGDPVLARFAGAIAAAPALRWLGYLSTVGVYGDRRGGWVDEDTPPAPGSDRGRRRLAAEEAWAALAKARGVPLAIFRVAGIYGPGRNAFVNLAEGTAHRVATPGHVFNRIHVDDIAGALETAVAREANGVFNLADDEPAPQSDVVAFAARLMGVAPPPEMAPDAAQLSPMARSFYVENRRVANGRLKSFLGVELRYPTYRAGLEALWKEGNWRG